MSPIADSPTTFYGTDKSHSSGSVPEGFQVSKHREDVGRSSTRQHTMSHAFGINEGRMRSEFFKQEPCFYTHEVFRKAAHVFDVLKAEREDVIQKRRKSGILKPVAVDFSDDDFKDGEEKRLTYELGFNTLKYQNLLEDILEDSGFFSSYPELQDYQGLVMVMLYDYQNRKFQQRRPINGEKLLTRSLEVEGAMHDSKTKLNACLAKRRVKASVPSIEHLLPENVRRSLAKKIKMPLYFWVNKLKTSVSAVIDHFQNEQYELVTVKEDALESHQFRVDNHCNDVLVFSPGDAGELMEHSLVLSGQLVRQDKSSCLAPHSVTHLLNDDDDIIHVNIGSGLTSAHLASLLHKGKNHIWAYGGKTDAEITKIRSNLDRLGAKSVKLLHHESFVEADPDDSRFKVAKVVLITAECSKSGLTDPIEFIVSEGEDMTILKDLSEGETDMDRIGQLIAEHGRLLRNAMKFPKVQAVVYMTHSVHEAENENVVQKSIEYINMVQQKKVPYRLVPPVLPYTGEEIENDDGIDGKYMKFKPSSIMNGCFVAVVTREPEDVKEVAKDIIARAAKKGLMGKSYKGADKADSSSSSEKLKKGSRSGRRGSKKAKSQTSAAPSQFSVSSPIHAYIREQAKRKSQPDTELLGVDRSTPRSRASSAYDDQHVKPVHTPEHMKVIKHPAPFR